MAVWPVPWARNPGLLVETLVELSTCTLSMLGAPGVLSRGSRPLVACLGSEVVLRTSLTGLREATRPCKMQYSSDLVRRDQYNTPPTNYVQLLQHIVKTKDLDKMERLVNNFGDKFDLVHACAAVTRLPRVVRGPLDQQALENSRVKEKARERTSREALLVKRLTLMVWTSLNRCRSRELSGCISALSKLPHGPYRKDANKLVQQMLKELMENVNGRSRLLATSCPLDIAVLAISLARLGGAPKKILEQMAEYAETRRFAPRQLSMTVWGLASVGPLPVSLMRKCDQEVVARRFFFLPSSLALVSWSLARNDYKSKQLLVALKESTMGQIYKFRAVSIGMLAQAYCRWRHYDSEVIDALSRQLLATVPKKGPLPTVAFGRMCELWRQSGQYKDADWKTLVELLAERLPEPADLCPGDIVRIAGGLTLAGRLPSAMDAPERKVMDHLAGSAIIHKEIFSPDDTIKLLKAVTTLDYREALLLDKMAPLLMRGSSRKQLDASDMVSALTCYFKLGHRHIELEQQLTNLLEPIFKKADDPEYTASKLIRLISQLQPPHPLLALHMLRPLLHKVCKASTIGNSIRREVVHFLWLCAQAGAPAAEVFPLATNLVKKYGPTLVVEEAVNLLGSYVEAGASQVVGTDETIRRPDQVLGEPSSPDNSHGPTLMTGRDELRGHRLEMVEEDVSSVRTLTELIASRMCHLSDGRILTLAKLMAKAGVAGLELDGMKHIWEKLAVIGSKRRLYDVVDMAQSRLSVTSA